jgi:hypothetical protein
MTTGFVLFGVGLAAFAWGVRSVRPMSLAALAAGLCTLAVAAVPLDAGRDGLHGVLAGAGYAALVAVPATAVRPLGRRGTAAAVVAFVAAACLLASVVVAGPDGLLQRLGLTLVDAWIAVTALRLWRGRTDVTSRGGAAYARPRRMLRTVSASGCPQPRQKGWPAGSA